MLVWPIFLTPGHRGAREAKPRTLTFLEFLWLLESNVGRLLRPNLPPLRASVVTGETGQPHLHRSQHGSYWSCQRFNQVNNKRPPFLLLRGYTSPPSRRFTAGLRCSSRVQSYLSLRESTGRLREMSVSTSFSLWSAAVMRKGGIIRTNLQGVERFPPLRRGTGRVDLPKAMQVHE